MHQSFDIHLAEIYGVEQAVLIHHFQKCISFNKKLDKNQFEGRTWVSQTMSEIAAAFPYWSFDQVYILLEKAVKLKILRKGNFNKTKFDGICWYAFEDEERFINPNQACF